MRSEESSSTAKKSSHRPDIHETLESVALIVETKSLQADIEEKAPDRKSTSSIYRLLPVLCRILSTVLHCWNDVASRCGSPVGADSGEGVEKERFGRMRQRQTPPTTHITTPYFPTCPVFRSLRDGGPILVRSPNVDTSCRIRRSGRLYRGVTGIHDEPSGESLKRLDLRTLSDRRWANALRGL
jgi:hypothetical protein